MAAGDEQIEQLIAKNAVTLAVYSKGQCVSNIFLRPKHNMGWRLILNLSSFNWTVAKNLFKMETLDHIIAAMSESCWMCIFNLSDAYLTLPVNSKFWPVLRFYWCRKLLQYVIILFGLKSSLFLFSKVVKVLVSHLRKMGYIVIFYLDDEWQCGRTYEECLEACIATHNLFISCSFLPNYEKSCMVPSQKVTVFSFELDSVKMVISISKDKEKKILELIKITLTSQHTIRQIAKLIGKLISIMRVLPRGKQFYRSLEHDKLWALRKHKGCWDSECILSLKSHIDLLWWCHNIPGAQASLKKTNPDCLMQTDSSNYAWGSHLGKLIAQGNFSPAEKELSINTKETLAIWSSLCSFRQHIRNCHLKI